MRKWDRFGEWRTKPNFYVSPSAILFCKNALMLMIKKKQPFIECTFYSVGL